MKKIYFSVLLICFVLCSSCSPVPGSAIGGHGGGTGSFDSNLS